MFTSRGLRRQISLVEIRRFVDFGGVIDESPEASRSPVFTGFLDCFMALGTPLEIRRFIFGYKFSSITLLENALLSELSTNGQIASRENSVFQNVELQVLIGSEWVKATKENFPKDKKLSVTLPYPVGTGMNTHDFTVAHMFTVEMHGHQPGQIETPPVAKGESGITVELDGLLPVAVSWNKIDEKAIGSLSQTGDTAKSLLYGFLALIALVSLRLLIKKK